MDHIQASQSRVEAAVSALVRPSPPTEDTLVHALDKLTRKLEKIGVDDVECDFREETVTLVHATANLFYLKLNRRSHVDAAGFVFNALYVTADFANPPRRWTPLATQTLLHTCIRLRVEEWITAARGYYHSNQRANRTVSRVIDAHCYFSVVCHFRRVWDEFFYDDGLELADMMDSMIGKFGDDVECYDLDSEIFYTYGARPITRPIPPPNDIGVIGDSKGDESSDDDDEFFRLQ